MLLGGSQKPEFLLPIDIGEDTFVRSAGGYAANVAVNVTAAAKPQDFSEVPSASVAATPGAQSIAALVQQLARVGDTPERSCLAGC